jgi:GTP cyclohydrolase IA
MSELGKEINNKLSTLGIETPRLGFSREFNAPDIERYFVGIMNALDLDLGDDSLKDTPRRVAKMYTEELFYGLDYARFPACTTIENKMGYDELIVVDSIDVRSACEHHLVPFFGVAHIGYIPGTKILGLSKFNRIVDFFSRRPQVQERLTAQIYSALEHILATPDIAVVVRCRHMCVMMRGIKQSETMTTTSKMGGRFMEKQPLREEFMSIIKQQGGN